MSEDLIDTAAETGYDADSCLVLTVNVAAIVHGVRHSKRYNATVQSGTLIKVKLYTARKECK